MAVNISQVMQSTGLSELWALPDWKARLEAHKSREDAEALSYLRAKFPEVEEKAFFMSCTGEESRHVIEASSVCKAAQIERACAVCKGKCTLSERRGKPVVSIQETSRGVKYLSIGWTCGIPCRYGTGVTDEADFEQMFMRSGIPPLHREYTFANYKAGSTELTNAKTSAMKAASDGTNLILAGLWGTGKTHLATAVAINAIKNGRQSVFRLVSELCDELREANFNGDYYGLMRLFKNAPCLVLDDLGKERITEAGREYLYQIIDYRYRYGKQTLITTNAASINELSAWGNPEYVMPMVSRVLERGKWVTLNNSKDYRLKRGGEQK